MRRPGAVARYQVLPCARLPDPYAVVASALPQQRMTHRGEGAFSRLLETRIPRTDRSVEALGDSMQSLPALKVQYNVICSKLQDRTPAGARQRRRIGDAVRRHSTCTREQSN